MKLKNLIEKRNSLIAKMNDLLTAADTEARAFTEDEQTQFDDMQKEARALADTIHRNEQMEGAGLADRTVNKNAPAADDGDIDAAEARAFADYLRGVSMNGTSSAENEARAANMTFGNNGALVPTTIANKILQQVKNISPIYRMATHYNLPGTVSVPYVDTESGDITVGYQEEFVDITASTHKYGSVTLKGFLYGALTLISKQLINNAQFDVVPLVIDHMAENIAVWVDKEHLNGTTNKITGCLPGVKQIVTAAKMASVTADELIDVQEQLPDVYQQNACWIMSKKTRAAIRKLKDGDGNYLLVKTFSTDGVVWDLLGKPVFVSDSMPEMAKNAMPILYGDLSGYAIKESETLEIQVLVEKYATQHAVGVVAWGEQDGKVENAQKLAALKMPAADTQTQADEGGKAVAEETAQTDKSSKAVK